MATSGKLSWSCGGTDFNYDLYLATDADFKNRVGGTNAYNSGKGNSCSYSNLKEGQNYYWKVCVWDADGNSYWIDGNKSNYWSFKTKTGSGSSTVSTPDYNTISISSLTSTAVTVKWGEVSSATSYDVQVSSSSSFSNAISGSGMPGRTSCSFAGLQASTDYYIRIRARNGSLRSEWTKAYAFRTSAAKSDNELTEPAELYLYGQFGFGTTSMKVNRTYHFKTKVENREKATWIGHFYLKDGNETIKPFYDKKISAQAVNNEYLEFDYTPKETGTKTLILYYQTGKHGGGRPVNGTSSLTNQLKIVISEDNTVNNELKLNSNISCDPSTFIVGEKATLKASIINNGTAWSGTIYYTDNGGVVGKKHFDFDKGENVSISCSWEPQSAGEHNIALAYLTDGSNGSKLELNGNGYSNPIRVSVSKVDNTTTSTSANISLITEGLAPTIVNPGAEVNYFFRITNNEGVPLQGLRATIGIKGSSKANLVYTSYSDEKGISQLCVLTDGDNAIANIGQTVSLSCSGIIDSKGNGIQTINTFNPIKLKIRDGVSLNKVNKMKFTIEAGANGKLEAAKWLSLSAGYSYPTSTSFQWDANGNPTSVSCDSETKLEGNGKFKLFSYLDVDVKGEYGMRDSKTYRLDDPFRTTIMMTKQMLDVVESRMDWTKQIAYNAFMSLVEDWIEDTDEYQKFQRTIKSQSSSKYYGWGGKVTGRLLSGDTQKLGAINKYLSWPDNLLIKGLSFEGGGALKFEPEKVSESDGKKQWGTSASLKYNGKGDFDGLIGAAWFVPSKSWWEGSTNLEKSVGAGLSAASLFFGSQNMSGVISLSEEELYEDEARTKISELSNKFEVTTGKGVAFSEFEFCPDWTTDNSDVSASLTMTVSHKLSSKGAYAKYLQLLAEKSDEYKEKIADVFPAFLGESIISTPWRLYNVWNDDFANSIKLLPIPNTDAISLQKALKVEQQNTSKADFSIEIPIVEYTIPKINKELKLSAKAAITLEAENHPSESYYSVHDQRLFPVVVQPVTSIKELTKDATDWISGEIKSAFNQIKEALGFKTEELTDAESKETESKYELTTGNSHNKQLVNAARKRHPKLAEIEQSDICTLSFTLNEGTKNFDDGVGVNFLHYYPAGDLLAETENGDTLFVVSELANIEASKDGTSLDKSQYGSLKLDTYVGVDDLTPFGFSDDVQLDLYYSEPGSKKWKYVGPAGTSVNVENLGAYVLATSIKNDVISPELYLDFDSDSGLLHLTIVDNIGIKTSTLQVIVNGKKYTAVCLNESNYEILLSKEELEYRLDVNAFVYDLAGNRGETSQLFQLDKPEKINIEDLPDTDISELENTIYTEPVSATSGGDVTLSVKMKNCVEAESFQFDLELPEGISVVQDEDGFAEAELSLERTSKKKTDTFTSAFLENGALRVIAGSTGGYSFSGNDGEVATIKLHIDKNVPIGNYPIVLRNISISDTNAESHDVAYVKSTIYVGEGLIGEVNGDDVVNAQDVVDLILYMMGKKQLDFNAADVNGDGVINSADVIMVSNSILKN